jgi:D-psicose/D-tagatose/L-ribulose 3-epimerase
MNLLLWTYRPTMAEHAPLIKQIKEWGFDGVEFPVFAMGNDDIRQLAKLCDDLGLGRTAILAYGADAANPLSKEPAQRQAAVDLLRKSIDQTRELGSDVLVGPMQVGLGYFTGAPPTDDEWSRSVDVIHQAAEYAATMHITLGVEPLNRFEMYLTNTIDSAARFCRDVDLPNVGILADTHHSNIEEERPARAWKKAMDSIVHVHISENNRGVPGRGQAIPPAIFRTLRRGGYDGWLVIESFGNKVPELIGGLHLWRPYFDDEDEVAVEGLRFIRQGWQNIG